jgi:D-methionine transport system ATP-binding protein
MNGITGAPTAAFTRMDSGRVNGAAELGASSKESVLPANNDTMLLLDGVAKRFGGVRAIENISFEVKRGEILGVIGRSGAGKSTLIRCLNGLEKPDAGRVEILGEDIAPLAEKPLRRVRGRIGMIFQHFNLLSAKTAADNIALPLKIAGWPRAERQRRVAALLELVGLQDKASAYPAQLSGGQKQRVGIARALAAEPGLLLSDEATSALDPETTRSILALLRDINQKLGLTIVLITHEMSVIKGIANRVIVLDAGRIVEQGDAATVFANPQAEATRSLLAAGAAPENGAEPFFAPGAQFRMILEGDLADQPVLSDLTLATAARPTVLAARTTLREGLRATTIDFALDNADAEVIARAELYLRRAGANLERRSDA